MQEMHSGEVAISPTKKATCTRTMNGSKMPVTTSWSPWVLINATGTAAYVTATTDPLLAACRGRTAPLAAPGLPGRAGSAA